MDQLSISVSDGLHRSAPIPLYIIINPTNDEAPSLLLANFTVRPPRHHPQGLLISGASWRS